eukprot:14946719-Heterocapsa_arctica.AAC.1
MLNHLRITVVSLCVSLVDHGCITCVAQLYHCWINIGSLVDQWTTVVPLLEHCWTTVGALVYHCWTTFEARGICVNSLLAAP